MSIQTEGNQNGCISKANTLPDKCPENSVSLQRWRILKEALLGGRSSALTCQSVASVRRFQTFDLLHTKLLPINDGSAPPGDWYEYTAAGFTDFKMTIRHLPGIVKPETLLGFNNTGNVCVWPAEEILTYFCLRHLDMFSGKSICELGGGMTCLAGVAVGVSCDVKEVLLTDGNEESVMNLEFIISRNTSSFNQSKVSSRVLRWGNGPLDSDLFERFDVILCADCLFFEDGRQDLVDTIHSLLKPEGEAILFAPSRGETFDAFVKLAEDKFEIEMKENYDDAVWDQHCKFKAKGSEHYDPNIHYPLYLHLQKIPSSRETSMER